MTKEFRAYRRRMIAVLIVIYATEMFFRNCMNVSKATLETAFGFGAATWGALGSAYSYAQLPAMLPSGIVADYFDTKKVYLVFLAVLSAGSIVFLAAPNLAVLSLGRVLIGLSEVFLFPAWIKIVGQWYDKRGQDILIGFSTFLAYAVGILALSPLSFSLERFSWRLVYSVPAAVALVLLALTSRYAVSQPSQAGFQPPPGSDSAHVLQRASLGELIKGALYLLRQWRTWPPLLMLVGVYGASYTLNGVWGSSFLEEAYGISAVQASELLSFVLVGTAVSSLLSPLLSRALGSRRIPLAVTSLGTTVCWVIFLSGAGRLPPETLRLIFLLIGLFNTPAILGLLLVKEMHPAKYAGVSTSLFSLGAVFGGALVPTIIGRVYEALGSGVDNYRIALCVTVAALAVATICSCATETHCMTYEARMELKGE